MVKSISPTLPHQECSHTQAVAKHRNTRGKMNLGVTTTSRMEMESIQILPPTPSLQIPCMMTVGMGINSKCKNPEDKRCWFTVTLPLLELCKALKEFRA